MAFRLWRSIDVWHGQLKVLNRFVFPRFISGFRRAQNVPESRNRSAGNLAGYAENYTLCCGMARG